MLIKAFANEPISFYFHNTRHDIDDKFVSKFNNKFLKDIDEKYYQAFKKGTLQKNDLFFTAIYNPFENKKIAKLAFLNSSVKKKKE